jgi:hypothetical protein
MRGKIQEIERLITSMLLNLSYWWLQLKNKVRCSSQCTKENVHNIIKSIAEIPDIVSFYNKYPFGSHHYWATPSNKIWTNVS